MDSIDDNEELEYTEDAFNVLGFRYEIWQNYIFVEQKGMVFDILINFWWKYQVYKYINLDEDVKVDENVKIDEKI